jgi:hypothetical protein
MVDTVNINETSKLEAWFDDFIATLKSHQVQLETSTASAELKHFYETLFGGNPDDIAKMNKQLIQQHFVRRIVVDYLDFLKGNEPLRLAFDFNDSEVLVWAEIENDSWVKERALLKAESFVNAKYHNYGFDMETTIVEANDLQSIPNHYRAYKS